MHASSLEVSISLSKFLTISVVLASSVADVPFEEASADEIPTEEDKKE